MPLMGYLLDALTCWKLHPNNFTSKSVAIEEIMRDLPLSDDQEIESSIKVELEKIAQDLNFKYDKLHVAVKCKPIFVEGIYNKQIIPARGNSSWCLQFYSKETWKSPEV